jgi:hypothetical protein
MSELHLKAIGDHNLNHCQAQVIVKVLILFPHDEHLHLYFQIPAFSVRFKNPIVFCFKILRLFSAHM